MKQIKTKSGDIIIISISEQIPINRPNGITLGKLSELTDKDCEEFCYYFEDEDLWMNYNKIQPYIPYKETAKESFISLLQSKGIDTSKEDKLLIIKIL